LAAGGLDVAVSFWMLAMFAVVFSTWFGSLPEFAFVGTPPNGLGTALLRFKFCDA
jgi:hypothetical protein